MKRRSYVLTSILAGALALAGCEGDTSTSASTGAGASISTTSSGIDTAADTTTATAVETGTVKLSVAFPESNAEKALISSDTQWVGFRYCRVPEMETGCYYQEGMPGNGEVQVTRADPSATVMLAPGMYQFEAATFASEDMSMMIDYAASGGEIVEGANTVKMTFLQGDWSFKTAAGADDTITLGNGTVFDGFKLYAYGDSQGTPAAARKSAFNKALPAGFTEYGVALKTSAGEKDGGWVVMLSQFHGGNNNNASMMGIDYNLTQDCLNYDGCDPGPGDWFLFMMGDPSIEASYEGDALWSLLPEEGLTDADGNPIDVSGNSSPTDGVTITADFVEGQSASRNFTLVDTTAGAAKAVAADMPLSRDAALKSALAADADSASKSATTTTIGTVNSTWYDPVIMASGDGSNRGTWNFDDGYWDNELQQYVTVPDGCLQTDLATGKVYAECGWLETTWEQDPVTFEWVVTGDPGEFSWGFAPTDPNNLGEYDCVGSYPEGYYEPWCFWDQNGDGTLDMGSFQFTHYMKVDETVENVRMHRVTAKGVELPGTEVILQ